MHLNGRIAAQDKIGSVRVLFQCAAHRVIDRIKDDLLIGKFDLQLCRMHINIHRRRIHINKQHACRKPLGRYVGGKRLLKRRHSGAALDVAVVDEKVLEIARRLDIIGRADKAVYFHALAAAFDRQHAPCKVSAEHRINRVFELAVPRSIQSDIAVHDKADGDLGVRECNLLHRGGNRRRLGGIFFQKLTAGRRVGKQLLHRNGRAGRASRLTDRNNPAAVGIEHCTVCRLGSLRQDAHLGDRGDRGKRLAAETERENSGKVFRRGDFAGRVALERQRHIFGRHATSVVRDAHIADAAVLDLDGDLLCACVDGILHQLLDHGGRSVHDLTCGNEVCHLKAQDIDFSHAAHFLSQSLSSVSFSARRSGSSPRSA